MRKIFALLFVSMIFAFSGCTDYLSEPPNKGGNDLITKISDLDKLLDDPMNTRVFKSDFMQSIYASDDCDMNSELLKYTTRDLNLVAFNIWKQKEFENIDIILKSSWKSWSVLYTYNIILEKLNTLDGDPILKKRLEAEALFFRAYTHFNLAVQYCTHPSLNGGNNPGIDYRDATNRIFLAKTRNTVSYTFKRISEDLDRAEKLMNEAGMTTFDATKKWRVTLPSLYAFRARVEMYSAADPQTYNKTFEYARLAYEAYHPLYNMATNPIFEKEVRGKAMLPKAVNDMSYTYQNLEFYFVHIGFTFDIVLPPSQDLYNLYEVKDLRKDRFFDNNYNLAFSAVPVTLANTLISKSYIRYTDRAYYKTAMQIGPSVMEMMLIMAECRARGAGSGDDAQTILRNLRKNRFPVDYTDGIGGTLTDVKNERRRELPFIMRWYDLKRYNAIDKANITIKKQSLRNIYDLNSGLIDYELLPNAGFYALPIPISELKLLGWEQNEYSGVKADGASVSGNGI